MLISRYNTIKCYVKRMTIFHDSSIEQKIIMQTLFTVEVCIILFYQ